MKNAGRVAVAAFGFAVLALGILIGRGIERKAIADGDIACPRTVGYHLNMHSEADEVRKMFVIPKDSDSTVVRIYVEREDTGERMRIKDWSLRPLPDQVFKMSTPEEIESFMNREPLP